MESEASLRVKCSVKRPHPRSYSYTWVCLCYYSCWPTYFNILIWLFDLAHFIHTNVRSLNCSMIKPLIKPEVTQTFIWYYLWLIDSHFMIRSCCQNLKIISFIITFWSILILSLYSSKLVLLIFYSSRLLCSRIS